MILEVSVAFRVTEPEPVVVMVLPLRISALIVFWIVLPEPDPGPGEREAAALTAGNSDSPRNCQSVNRGRRSCGQSHYRRL